MILQVEPTSGTKEREAVLQQLERWPTMGDAEVFSKLIGGKTSTCGVLTSQNLGEVAKLQVLNVFFLQETYI